jgi:hypothetical protein
MEKEEKVVQKDKIERRAEQIIESVTNRFLSEYSERSKGVIPLLTDEDIHYVPFHLFGPKELSLENLENLRETLNKNVPWEKIKKCLVAVKIKDEAVIRHIVQTLKPIPIEMEIKPTQGSLYTWIIDRERAICSYFNKKIKNISPVIKRLENLYQEEPERRVCLVQSIELLQDDVRTYKKVIEFYKNNRKTLLKSYSIDKDLRKSPQKQAYWNKVIPATLKLISKFCRDEEKRKTGKTIIPYSKLIEITAKLLKILYPTIWTENVPTIAHRIKMKDYRMRYPV